MEKFTSTQQLDSPDKKKVLFICSHNAGRSQMAEGFLRELYGDKYEAYSAGTQVSEVNPLVIKVMEELGIDMSRHRSKSIEEFRDMEFDYVVTVCDQVGETCPFFPGGKKYLHENFDDPSKFKGTEEEIFASIRKVRDEIKERIKETFGK